ncbi:MAG: universal stress protein [Alphaproteobacteria bacterium]
MYKAILVPVDLEHESSWRKALPAATMLADTCGAALHLLTVVPDIRTQMVSQYFPTDFEKKAAADAATRLKAFAGQQLAGRDVKLHVKTGSVYRSICAEAERLGIDLIVMGSHRPELADILIGPNAEQVARHAPISVLIVRA